MQKIYILNGTNGDWDGAIGIYIGDGDGWGVIVDGDGDGLGDEDGDGYGVMSHDDGRYGPISMISDFCTVPQCELLSLSL